MRGKLPNAQHYFNVSQEEELGQGGFLRVFLAGSLIIERIFNLDGIGLLSFNSILARDYNVIMGITFISALLLLAGNILSDVIYVMVDPRIDFK